MDDYPILSARRAARNVAGASSAREADGMIFLRKRGQGFGVCFWLGCCVVLVVGEHPRLEVARRALAEGAVAGLLIPCHLHQSQHPAEDSSRPHDG